GALVAVPTAAVVNTVVNHLAGNDIEPEPPGRLRNGKNGNGKHGNGRNGNGKHAGEAAAEA
ncbi:MAG TPA: hypothetical protein VGJ44_15230, partial [Kribbellaceae bacterium]